MREYPDTRFGGGAVVAVGIEWHLKNVIYNRCRGTSWSSHPPGRAPRPNRMIYMPLVKLIITLHYTSREFSLLSTEELLLASTFLSFIIFPCFIDLQCASRGPARSRRSPRAFPQKRFQVIIERKAPVLRAHRKKNGTKLHC